VRDCGLKWQRRNKNDKELTEIGNYGKGLDEFEIKEAEGVKIRTVLSAEGLPSSP